jgi:hypothetical protein
LEGDIKLGLKYGVTLAAMALSQHGDMVITTKPEMISLANTSSTITR